MPMPKEATRARWRNHVARKRKIASLSRNPVRPGKTGASGGVDSTHAAFLSATVDVEDYRYVEDDPGIEALICHARSGVLFGHRLIRRSTDPFGEAMTRLEIAIEAADPEKGKLLLKAEKRRVHRQVRADEEARTQAWLNEARPKRKRQSRAERPESYAPIVGWITCPEHGITYHSSYKCSACATTDPMRDALRDELREREKRLQTELELVQMNLDRLEGE